jgi:mannose-6-phosphate isomerase-like protein (cupin superfamily)
MKRGQILACSGLLLAALAAVGCSVARSQPPNPIMNISLQHFDGVEEVKYPWGWIRWLMNSKLDAGSAQTFGIVEIRAGRKNSLHMHPNCEELLYVLSGSCEHRVGDKKAVLKPGDLVRIPARTPHQATVHGKEPLRAVISYSSGDRQVVDLGPGKE